MKQRKLTTTRTLIAVATITLALLSAHSAKVTASVAISENFTAPTAWPGMSAINSPGTSGVLAYATRGAYGTIDVAHSTQQSGALKLRVLNAGLNTSIWKSGLRSGYIPISNTETNLAKLTLSFDCSISSVRPVEVWLDSFNASKVRTGTLQGTIYPATSNFFQRSAIDLSDLTPSGPGTFQPTDPYLRLTFKIGRAASAQPPPSEVDLTIDNVEYATPAFYVNPTGSDSNDGRSEATAFATPQRAVNVAQAGDIILLMSGTYSATDWQYGVVGFVRAGTPAAWITLKNYPGQEPILTSKSWNTVKVGRSYTGGPSVTDPALAYIEIRGLHLLGNANIAQTQFPKDIGQGVADTNTNGISIDGGQEANVPHHIRIANNTVEYCCGGGITAGQSDYITTENNISRNNCWWTIYAPSGISYLTTANFDGTDNVYHDLIRNNVVSGNQCFEKWSAIGAMSDGNGIIVDSNNAVVNGQVHNGRTLIQDNLSFGNGGSGIHAFHSHRVDIVNNTAYYNGATPALNWGQIFVQQSDDINMDNNIEVSRAGQYINTIGSGGDQSSTNVARSNNIYWGGIIPTLTGPNDQYVDPKFVNSTMDSTTANFTLLPGSPGLKSAAQLAFSPLTDILGKTRPTTSPSDRGCYQH